MITNATRREPPTGWFKSSFSANNASCVEIKFDNEVVRIRDTKDHGTGPPITTGAAQWRAFLNQIAR